ncbi:FecCD family ABC transporter permease [Streptomyces scopuliridis]|uniref:FecCD family ABC transporter permease n=1 Tax=Streptomyces scopuliridis TaxID=452529 RepID=UPI0036AFFCA5
MGLLLTAGVLAVATWASLVAGSGDAGAGEVVRALLDPDLSDKGQLIVREVRVPRTVAGLLAGAALGLAGAVMQGVARNPLADPGILGINAGASVVVVFAIGVLGLTEPSRYIWFGFLGALGAALLVYGIGSLGREGATPMKLALAGAATSAALGSLTTAILLTDRQTFDRFRFWQVGSLADRDPQALWQALPFIGVGAVFALALGPRLNALSLGDDLARALGQRVGLARLASAAAVVLLCGAATAIAGPIGFVGLLVPHAARLVTGPDYRWILPYSLLLAPVLVLVSDIVGRIIAPPGEVQVGIVTAAIGAVPFVLLVRRRNLVEL